MVTLRHKDEFLLLRKINISNTIQGDPPMLALHPMFSFINVLIFLTNYGYL